MNIYKSEKGFLAIKILVVLLILFGLFVSFNWIKAQKSNLPSISNSPLPVTITYGIKDLGISIIVPENFEIDDRSAKKNSGYTGEKVTITLADKNNIQNNLSIWAFTSNFKYDVAEGPAMGLMGRSTNNLNELKSEILKTYKSDSENYYLSDLDEISGAKKGFHFYRATCVYSCFIDENYIFLTNNDKFSNVLFSTLLVGQLDSNIKYSKQEYTDKIKVSKKEGTSEYLKSKLLKDVVSSIKLINNN